MESLFTPYDQVRPKRGGESWTGVILDYQFRVRDEIAGKVEVSYRIRTERGATLYVWEDQLETVGRLEAPFGDYEVVEMRPKREEAGEPIRGKRGVIVGSSWNPDTDQWGFAVALQTGECWSLMDDELVSTGKFLPDSVVRERESGPHIRVGVTLEGEGVILDAPADLPASGPVPFPVNLDEL